MSGSSIILLVGMFITTSSISQQPDYIVKNTLGKFEGTWIWANGSDTVRLFLRKEKVNTGGNVHIDMIVGYRQYKQGATIIEDSYSNRSLSNISQYRSFLGGNIDGGNVLSGSLRGLVRKKPLRLNLTLNISQTELTWHSYIEGVRINEIAGQTLPGDIVLIKQ